ncbi:MAG: hypothetical protein COW00_03415 [Bdellovibrio sp. CG12_big_fil_rev_8_21_14_0_65_39_13]|nr:MAG: hypothetical protein COW78_10820 [Bdellovibrio sp. CG22_combo_CG10-13_8_21_14_all_39_27]PIQ61626.1 MAG: hypothetical protein COW00_03415 [Bdellovibrio sp. CG12_big_fil_rev_8_21_14_0_65_39_13]PIR35689.1 MAG: hypothetical protein COV37_07210 [Bdellovibrio sp. CG11_big_fil_rev_8_21_14_0_20_39_38]
MKNLILVIVFILTSQLLWAGEVTGAGQRVDQILKNHGMSRQQLASRGLKVLMGEVTGAGKTIQVEDLEFVVAKNKIYNQEALTHIEFKIPSAARVLTDIKSLEFGSSQVDVLEIDAFIVR